MSKGILAFGIISLFILSALAPMSLGYYIRTTEESIDDFDRHLYPESYDAYSVDEIYGYGSIDDIKVEPRYRNIESKEIESFKELIEPLNAPMDSAWPMYCHDVKHTGRSPYSTADNPGIEKWRFDIENHGSGDPVIDKEGIIYIGSHDFYAIYPNGTLKWKYDTPMVIRSAAAIDENGVIYVGTYLADTSYLYAFYPDGTVKWKYYTSGSIWSSPAIAEDGSIIFADSDNWNIIALFPDGTLKWSYHANHVIHSDPAIDNNTVYCGSHDGALYALYLNNGTLKWKYNTGDWVARGPSIADDGTVYFGSWDGHLYACYPNGTLKWKTNVGASTTPVIAQDGTLYIGLTYLSAINPDNGNIIWKFNPGPDRTIRGAGPSISADGTIYFGTHIGEYDGGELIAVNPDGTERWRIMLATSWIWSAPAIGEDGTIYIGACNDKPPSMSLGYLHAINALDPNAPLAPEINGPASGKEETVIDFYFTSTSPLGRDVYYYVEWGDGKVTDWTGPFKSGESATISHLWYKVGTMVIKARAKDTDNLWGPYGEFEIEITRPRTRAWLRFMDMFPILQRLLDFIR